MSVQDISRVSCDYDNGDAPSDSRLSLDNDDDDGDDNDHEFAGRCVRGRRRRRE